MCRSRLQLEAQYAVIKALDRVARRLSSNPKLAARVFLDGEAILAAFCHFAFSPRRSRIALRTRKRRENRGSPFWACNRAEDIFSSCGGVTLNVEGVAGSRSRPMVAAPNRPFYAHVGGAVPAPS